MDTEQSALGYSEKVGLRLRFFAAISAESGSKVVPALLHEAADLLTTDEDLDLIEERDALREAVRKATRIIQGLVTPYLATDPNAPVLSDAMRSELAAWLQDYGIAPLEGVDDD